MRVLLTNNTLGGRAGSELYVRDLAIELMRRGHHPVAYSTVLGEVAQELKAATVPVIDTLESLGEPPDIIHGHHHYETLAAMTWFPKTPAIYYCHGWLPSEEAPLRFPRILRYVAVDEICQERLITEGAIPRQRIELILNFFDENLFQARAAWPSSPRSALAFGHAFRASQDMAVLGEACGRRGIELHGLDRVESQTGPLLARYDIVFAKARAAIEAMATGAAVVLCHAGRLGPMVTTENFQSLRQLNFGLRTLSRPLDAGLLAGELERYDAADAAAVSKLVWHDCRMAPTVDRIVELYKCVIAEWRDYSAKDPAVSEPWVARYLEQSAPAYKSMVTDLHRWIQRCQNAEQALIERESHMHAIEISQAEHMKRAQAAERSLEALQRKTDEEREQLTNRAQVSEHALKLQRQTLERERWSHEDQVAALTRSLRERDQRLIALQHDVDALRQSLTWRLIQSLLQSRLVQFLFRRMIEAVARRSQREAKPAPEASARALSTSR